MGCNCRKPKPPTQNKPKPQPSDEKAKGKTQSFSLDLGGRTLRFGSELEAKAARARNGGRGTIRPA